MDFSNLNISEILVSVDVSTCDEDADHRIFARPIDLVLTKEGKYILMCEKTEDN